MKEKPKWLTLDDDEYVVVLPESDSKPHAHVKEGETKAELAGADCPCNPKIISGGEGYMYGKPVIVHNSFDDSKFIDEAMAALKL